MKANLVTLLLSVAGVSAVPLERRAVIAHDAVVGFPETVPATATGTSYLKFKPWLKVVNGCVPFPAVNAAGDTSGGLSPTGDSSGGCSSSTGQVYVRGGAYGSMYAIMYSWYMPKDSPSSGLGHRHDWENAIVWVDDPTKASPTILALSASAHGGYDTITSGFDLSGTRPLIRYFSVWPVDHQLGFIDTQGGEQPLIAWESLTDAARTALTDTDFGDANVPFKDSNFDNNLAKAAP